MNDNGTEATFDTTSLRKLTPCRLCSEDLSGNVTACKRCVALRKAADEIERLRGDLKRVERIRKQIAHLRYCADAMPNAERVPFGATDGIPVDMGVHPSAMRLRRQAKDLEDMLEGRGEYAE